MINADIFKNYGLPYTYEKLPFALKQIVDAEVSKHKRNHPDDVFDILFTYYDEEKGQWMGRIMYTKKCDND